MRISSLLLVAALVAAPGTTSDLWAEDAPKSHFQTLAESRAAPVVSLKVVMAVTQLGNGRTRERTMYTRGVLVNDEGLIMVNASTMSLAGMLAGVPPAQRAQIEAMVSVAPSTIQVTFPGDPTEYPAILGATDSKMGLGFVLIKDLGEKQTSPVDLSKSVTPALGDKLYGVSRLGRDFDYAVYVDETRILGKISQPREVWAVRNASQFTGQPLYTKQGEVAGIVVNQSGAGENASTRTCLLPLDAAQRVIKRAFKASQDALEVALEAEEEAAAEAEAVAAGDGEKPEAGAEGEKPDGEPKPDAPKQPATPAKPDAPAPADPKEPQPEEPTPEQGEGPASN